MNYNRKDQRNEDTRSSARRQGDNGVVGSDEADIFSLLEFDAGKGRGCTLVCSSR